MYYLGSNDYLHHESGAIMVGQRLDAVVKKCMAISYRVMLIQLAAEPGDIGILQLLYA